MNYSATNHCTVNLVCLVPSIFIPLTLDGVIRFLSSKAYETYVNSSVTVKVLEGLAFRVMEANWQHLIDTLAFSLFLVC